MDTQILEQEFDQKQIKQRKGPGGKVLDYVESYNVIRRLNQAFDYLWSFDIDSYDMKDDEVIVLGKLTAEGITKTQFGSKKILNSKNNNSLGNDLKAAGSDCLKKCATLFGIALHLYGDGQAEKGSGMSTMTQNKGNNKVTKKQLAKIKELRGKLGWNPQQAIDLVEDLHGVENPLEMNQVMAKNVIAVLKRKAEESQKEKEEAESVI